MDFSLIVNMKNEMEEKDREIADLKTDLRITRGNLIRVFTEIDRLHAEIMSITANPHKGCSLPSMKSVGLN